MYGWHFTTMKAIIVAAAQPNGNLSTNHTLTTKIKKAGKKIGE